MHNLHEYLPQVFIDLIGFTLEMIKNLIISRHCCGVDFWLHLIIILVFSSILDVSLANLFGTSFGIALKVAFVWVLYSFKYLGSWFYFNELEILTSHFCLKIILSQGIQKNYLLLLSWFRFHLLIGVHLGSKFHKWIISNFFLQFSQPSLGIYISKFRSLILISYLWKPVICRLCRLIYTGLP